MDDLLTRIGLIGGVFLLLAYFAYPYYSKLLIKGHVRWLDFFTDASRLAADLNEVSECSYIAVAQGVAFHSTGAVDIFVLKQSYAMATARGAGTRTEVIYLISTTKRQVDLLNFLETNKNYTRWTPFKDASIVFYRIKSLLRFRKDFTLK